MNDSDDVAAAAPETARDGIDGFDLTRFFPYRMAVLAERVSMAVSRLYADRFDLSRAEWRVLAALGTNPTMAAKDIGPYSTLDKMQVSRALARLETRGLIRRQADAADRRAKLLRLTPAGRRLFTEIVPLVSACEKDLLAGLSAAEHALLERFMADVQARADVAIDRP